MLRVLLDSEISLKIWRSSAPSRIFCAFSPHAKLLHPIDDLKIGEYLVPIMFNWLGMNLRRPMILFRNIFDEKPLLHGYEKVWKAFKN
jgi:hypothetical protein